MSSALTHRMLLVTIVMMDLLTGVEFDLFVPSLPALQQSLSLSPFLVETLLSANFAGYCIGLFVAGSLADRHGRKPIILFGLTTFIVGSLMCLSRESYGLLLLGRGLQGLGIAAPAVLSFLIIADTYPLKQQQYLMALLSGIINVAAAAAPVVGSYITLYFQWRGNFMALFLLGLATFGMTLCFIPKGQVPAVRTPISLQQYKDLFRSKALLLLMVHFSCVFVAYWIFTGMSPLIYVKDLGVSLSQYGYYQGFLALVFAVGSLLFSFVITRHAQSKTLRISNHIFVLGLIAIAFVTLTDNRSPLMLTLAFLPCVIGQIVPTIILYPLCFTLLPQSKGQVSAVIQGSSLLVSALFLQIAGYCYRGSFQNVGIIIAIFMALSITTLFFIMQDKRLMEPE